MTREINSIPPRRVGRGRPMRERAGKPAGFVLDIDVLNRLQDVSHAQRRSKSELVNMALIAYFDTL